MRSLRKCSNCNRVFSTSEAAYYSHFNRPCNNPRVSSSSSSIRRCSVNSCDFSINSGDNYCTNPYILTVVILDAQLLFQEDKVIVVSTRIVLAIILAVEYVLLMTKLIALIMFINVLTLPVLLEYQNMVIAKYMLTMHFLMKETDQVAYKEQLIICKLKYKL